MAKYRVEYNGGTYEIESETELSDDQIRQALVSQSGPSQASAPINNEAPVRGSFDQIKNVGAEAFGGVVDMLRMAGGPGATRLYAQQALGGDSVAGIPTQGSPEFHNSAAGRAVRFAAPAAAMPGQSLFGATVSGLGAGAGGAIDFKAEQAGLPMWQRLPLAMAPNAAAGVVSGATKASIRGTPPKGAEMADNMAQLDQMGVKNFSISQVAPEGNARIPLIERAISYAFGGQGPFQKLAKYQSEQLKTLVGKIAGGSADDAEAAGQAVWNGLFKNKTGWVSRSKNTEKFLWQPVDAKFANVSAVKTKNLEKALDDIVKAYDNPQIAAAMGADKVGATKLLEAVRASGGKMSYSDFVRLRMDIGELQSGSLLIPSERGISAMQAGKLWGAMMEDYKSLTQHMGGASEFAAAHAFSKNYHQTSRNFFKTIFGKEAEPTKIIDEIASGQYQQPAKIRALSNALEPQDFQKLQEYVINRLGTPAGSKTGTFSLETFHTNYNNRFAGAGKSGQAVADAMFGAKGTPTRDSLETLFKFAEKTKDGSQLLFNTSGTAGSGLAGASIQALLSDLAKKSPAMLTGGAIGGSFAGPPGVAAGIVAGAGATNMAARLLTSPRFSKWLSQTAFQSGARLPAAMSVLSQMEMESEDMEEAKRAFIESFQLKYTDPATF